MEDDKNKSINNNEKIEIVSEDLLNPFGNIKKSNVNLEKKEESKSIDNNSFYDNSLNDKPITFNEINESNQKHEDNLQDKPITFNGVNENTQKNANDFYSNFEYNKNTSSNDVINIEKGSTSDLPDRKTSVPFIVMALLGFAIQFLNGYFVIIGFVICIISFIGSIIMYKRLAKHALLSIIMSLSLIIISVVMYVISYNSVNNYLNDMKYNIFKENAKSYINTVQLDVLANNKIFCDREPSSIKYYLSDIKKLIANNSLNEYSDDSYILIKYNEKCEYERYIYLKSNTYKLGDKENPLLESLIK